MTFIYEDGPYSLEIYRMCENELRTSSLVNVFESYRLTDRQTDRHNGNYMPRRFTGGQIWSSFLDHPV